MLTQCENYQKNDNVDKKKINKFQIFISQDPNRGM